MDESRREVPRVVGGRPHPDDRSPEPGELAASSREWGDLSLVLRIGALSIELVGLDDDLAALVRHNHVGFLAGGGDESTASARTRPVSLRVLRTPHERFLHLPRGKGYSEEARLEARFEPEGLELWSYFFAGSFDRDASAGKLLLCDAESFDRSQAIENYLRFFVSTLALAQGGFLLHASGVIRAARAVVFFGPSGAGKSTAARNSPGTERLGDDLVLIEPRHAGGYRACGVPFRGSFASEERNASTCAPLALACRLVQSTENRLERTSRPVQAAELVAQLPFLLDDPALRERAMERVLDFVRSVPVHRLHLRDDASFWEVLGRELEAFEPG